MTKQQIEAIKVFRKDIKKLFFPNHHPRTISNWVKKLTEEKSKSKLNSPAIIEWVNNKIKGHE